MQSNQCLTSVRRPRRAAHLWLGCFALAAVVRAQDPAVPPGGFPVGTSFDTPVVLDDGAMTAVDVQFPLVSNVPPTGWPLLVVCHVWNGSRTDYRNSLCFDYARNGYVTASYDYRGHGLFKNAPSNAGKKSDFGGVRDRRDLKLVIEHLLSVSPGLIDPARVGVFGFSLGGGMAWTAAAWSDTVCDDSDPGFGLFPHIACAAASGWDPSFASALTPETVSQSYALSNLLLGADDPLEPALGAALAAASDAENFTALHALALANRDVLVRLPTMTTPIMHSHSFGDRIFSPKGVVTAMASLPTTTPRLLVFGAVGEHGARFNQEESEVELGRLRAWLDRRLKGLPTPGDDGHAVQWAVEPADLAVADDPASAWIRRTGPSWPPAETAFQRRFLTDAGGADVAAGPSFQLPRFLIQSAPLSPLNATALRATDFDLATIRADLPQGELTYVGAPFAADTEFAGSFVVNLDVVPLSSAWQASVSFGFQTPAGFRSVAQAHRTERGLGASTAGPRSFSSDPFALRAPAGSIPVIKVRTQSEIGDVGTVRGSLRVLPILGACGAAVRHGFGTQSWVDLPVYSASRVGAVLTASRSDASVAATTETVFTFHGGAQGALKETILGLSLAGHQPGLPLGPLTLPLNLDALTYVALAAFDTWPLSGFIGQTDALGRRSATLTTDPLWLPPVLAGFTFTCAALQFDATGVTAVSNAVGLTLRP